MPAAKQRTRDSKPRKMRVFIVDDHPIVRHGFIQRLGLEPDMEVCGQAAKAQEALTGIGELKPDVALIDLSLEEGNGVDLIKELKTRGDKVKIIVVSSFDESAYAERSIRAGAHGYLNKKEAVDKIVDAIQRVAAGGYFLSEAMTAKALGRALSGKSDPGGSPLDTFSDREMQVYELLGSGLTVNQIAEKLFLSPKTIETYRENLKKKLDLKSSGDLLRHAIQWNLEHRTTAGGQSAAVHPS